MADSNNFDYINFSMRSWLKPSFGKKTEEDFDNMEGFTIHNPDGSDIKVDLSQYTGRGTMNNIFLEEKERIADLLNGGAYTYPEDSMARREDGLLASTGYLRQTLVNAYTKLAASEEGTEFFTQNAKQVFADYDAPLDSEVSWVSPQPSKNPAAGWEKGEVAGNVLYNTLSDSYALIYKNHRGVAAANLQAGQEELGQEKVLKNLHEVDEAGLAALVVKQLQTEPDLTPEQKAKMIEMVKGRPSDEVTPDREITEEISP